MHHDPRVSQLEGGRDFVDEPPMHSELFFYIRIAHAAGRASTPYRINLPARDIFMHPHRMDVRGSVKHLWATTGVSTHRQEHGTRKLPFVAGRCLLAVLASGLGSSVGAPSTTDPLNH
jgi:hypothetical protein